MWVYENVIKVTIRVGQKTITFDKPLALLDYHSFWTKCKFWKIIAPSDNISVYGIALENFAWSAITQVSTQK